MTAPYDPVEENRRFFERRLAKMREALALATPGSDEAKNIAEEIDLQEWKGTHLPKD